MTHLLIDGYNLIRQVPNLGHQEKISLEVGRNALIQKLSRYKKIKGHAVTVVFDGQSTLSEFAETHREAGINVAYSPYGMKADDVIKEMISKEKARVIVVTSDRDILIHAQRNGSGFIGSKEFYEKLVLADSLMSSTPPAGSRDEEGPAHKRWMTYKKGPSKKLSKRDRQNKVKLDKI